MKRIPDRWEKYLAVGCRVPGTRFLPFKVPLKPELVKNQPESEWFTPTMLLENTPMLKAVIDLTNTDRYYNYKEFTNKGVLYRKINVQGGGKVPPKKICDRFFEAVDQLCRELDHDSDALIGVHCTHGLNRTGYLICKYMVLRMKIDPQEAINKFQEARGYEIERRVYVSDIISPSSIQKTEERTSPSLSSELQCNYRAEPRPSSSIQHRRANNNYNFNNFQNYGRSSYKINLQNYRRSSYANNLQNYRRSQVDNFQDYPRSHADNFQNYRRSHADNFQNYGRFHTNNVQNYSESWRQ